MVYVLLIAKSDAYINLGLYEFAADDLLEAYNVDRDNAPHAFEVFSRIIKCYAAISDKENEKLFLEQIIALPNSAFPQRTDEEFKAYYVNQLENLK
jgi:hypothetical protein